MSNKKGTGFSAPTIGTILPKGSTFKKNPDGTITIVPPDNSFTKGSKQEEDQI